MVLYRSLLPSDSKHKFYYYNVQRKNLIYSRKSCFFFGTNATRILVSVALCEIILKTKKERECHCHWVRQNPPPKIIKEKRALAQAESCKSLCTVPGFAGRQRSTLSGASEIESSLAFPCAWIAWTLVGYSSQTPRLIDCLSRKASCSSGFGFRISLFPQRHENRCNSCSFF